MKPKYLTIKVTEFELRMLESLPEYKLGTDSPQWKAHYILKRILKRNPQPQVETPPLKEESED
jgi:hypothetical protein